MWVCADLTYFEAGKILLNKMSISLQGVRVFSNGWNFVPDNSYPTECKELDAFAWKNDALIVFSAGGD